jgi:TolB protein
MRLNLLLASVAALAAAAPMAVQAQVPGQVPATTAPTQDVVVDEGVLKPFQIAIAPFSGPNGPELSGVLSADLRRSGYFEPMDPRQLRRDRADARTTPPTSRSGPQIGAQAVLYGAVTSAARRPQRLSASACTTPTANASWPQLPVHRHARAVAPHRATRSPTSIYQRMTGETGLFDSRVVYRLRKRHPAEPPVAPRHRRIRTGSTPSILTQGDEIIMSPRFSLSDPDEITYVALGKDYSRIYLYNLSTGRRESLGEFDGQVLGPALSRTDGSKMAFSIIRGGNTDVYVMDLSQPSDCRRLTSDPGIDTSPVVQPRRAARSSSPPTGRAAPRLYVMRADGTRASAPIARGRRPLHRSERGVPRGDLIAFTKSGAEAGFPSGVMRPDGSGERILSSSYFEEGPSWAPNGRYIMFSRQSTRRRTPACGLSTCPAASSSQAGYNGRGSDPGLVAPAGRRNPSNLGRSQATRTAARPEFTSVREVKSAQLPSRYPSTAA